MVWREDSLTRPIDSDEASEKGWSAWGVTRVDYVLQELSARVQKPIFQSWVTLREDGRLSDMILVVATFRLFLFRIEDSIKSVGIPLLLLVDRA